MQQVVLAALVGRAVALDQPAAQRDLVPSRQSRCVPPRRPPASARSSPARARSGCRAGAATSSPARRAAPACRRRCGCRSSAAAPRRRAARHAPAVPGQQRVRERHGQQRRELRHARLEVVVHLQQVVVAAFTSPCTRVQREARLLRSATRTMSSKAIHSASQRAISRVDGEAVRAVRVGLALGGEHGLQALGGRGRRRPRPGSRASGVAEGEHLVHLRRERVGHGAAARRNARGRGRAAPGSAPAGAAVPLRHDLEGLRNRAGSPPRPCRPPSPRFVVLAPERNRPLPAIAPSITALTTVPASGAPRAPCRTPGARG